MTGTSPPRTLTVLAVLLTIGSAATDVACFTRLGSVFASVMTSNIVFLGLSAAQHSGMLAVRASIAVAAYAIGVAAASRLARTGQRAAGRTDGPGGSGRPGGTSGPGGTGGTGRTGRTPWSRWIAATLVTELLVLAVFTAGWEITGAKPQGRAQLLLLAVAAMAMGMQSAVVAVMGIAGVPTTYLTGTLTALIDSLAAAGPRSGTSADARRAAALGALVAGAGLSGLLLATAQAAVPAVPLVTVGGALIAGSVWLRAGRRTGRGKVGGRAGGPAARVRENRPGSPGARGDI